MDINVIDLFAGAGGLSKGFERAGYCIRAAIEFDKQIADTYKMNHSDTAILVGDIRNIKTEEILQEARMERDEIDLVMGGPPCQGFSQAGRRMIDDPRNTLFKEFVRVVKEIQPYYFLMENVTNLFLMKGGKIKQEIIEEFKKCGYKVDARILTAADYGVPQLRKRAIFIGNRVNQENPFPLRTHMPETYLTVKEAIGDLPARIIPGVSNESIPNHETKRLKDTDYERISHVPEGGYAPDIPKEIRPKEARRGGYFYDWYRRLEWNKPSRTIIATDKLYHPSENRKLSVRELARIQSFEDSFIFYGTIASQYKQVGNAVPPKMSYAIGVAIKPNIVSRKNLNERAPLYKCQTR